MLDGSPVRFKPVKYVIFDLDGTILDSESVMITVMTKLMEGYGIKFTNEVRLKLMGRKVQNIYNILVDEYDIPVSFEVFAKDRKALHDKYMVNLKLMPGAEWLITWLHDREVPIAIATSSSRDEFVTKTEIHKKLIKKFHHVTTGDDVENGKPCPDIFLFCASKFPSLPPPIEILVIEDSLSGVEAARSAGMQVVMLADKTISEVQKRRPTKVVTSLIDFDPKEFFIGRAHLP